MSAILLDKHVVHYEVLGRGRPLIFLHSWLGTWRYWIPMMQMASTNYRAYAIDLWGYGDTAKGTQLYTLEQQVALLTGFLDEMGIGQVALVGHGLGAIVGLQFASQNPGVVNRIMALGYPTHTGMINNRLVTEPLENLLNLVLEKSPNANSIRDDISKNDSKAISGFMRSVHSNRLEALWKQTNLTCLLVHGQDDPIVTVPGVEDWKDMPYNTHAIVFEQSGHFPMLDDVNKFSRLLVEFLTLENDETPRNLQLKEEWKRRVR